MDQTMEKYNLEGKTSYTDNNFNICTYVKLFEYPPKPVFTFSPYDEDADIYDIISATKDIRGRIEQIEPINKVTLTDAEQIFNDKLNEVIESDDDSKINLFILPTGIGKTQFITNMTGSTVTIAAPTNKLKDEIAGRMKSNYVVTPELPEFDNEELNSRIRYFYSVGVPNKAIKVLYNMVEGIGLSGSSASDIEKATNYIDALQCSNNTDKTVLTTHNRILFTDYRPDTIIFDEDPLNHLIDIKQLLISDFNGLQYIFPELRQLVNFLELCCPGEIIETQKFNLDLDTLADKIPLRGLDSNIFDYFNSRFFIRDIQNSNIIHYVVKRDLPKNKKIIILSASLPLYMYQKLFGPELNVVDVSDVEQTGKIIQYTQKSCSRNSLNRYHEKISARVGDKKVITFKSFSGCFSNPVENMYFGNCSGYDTLTGQDIVVVGTPHRNNIEYLLTAKVLGIDFQMADAIMDEQKIEYNGFRFKFNCFNHSELRNIQLALIESDLIQAVGRARTLRTNATVELYSNFPLRISTEFIY